MSSSDYHHRFLQTHFLLDTCLFFFKILYKNSAYVINVGICAPLEAVYAEVVEVEEYELGSDVEPAEAQGTLKLTSRRSIHSGPRRRARDETKKEIQVDDEASLRDLLIRYVSCNSCQKEIIERTIQSFHHLFIIIIIIHHTTLHS